MPCHPGGEFSAADVADTYDVAVSSVVDFIALANKTAPWSMTPMVKSDLIEQMFATPGDELFYIDTVEKAARWEIELVGVNFPSRIDEAHAFYACENTLQWRVGLQPEPFSFTEMMMSWPTEPLAKLVSEEGQLQVFDVTSRKAGYASAGCLIIYRSDGRLTTCAVDQYTGARWGSGDCRPNEEYETEWVSPLAVFKADTPITALRSPPSTERTRVECVVKSTSQAILDDEVCDARIAFEYEADGSASVLQVLIWPTGNQTVVRSGRGSHSVNGAPAERQYLEGFWGCYLNSATRNTLCISGLERRRAN